MKTTNLWVSHCLCWRKHLRHISDIASQLTQNMKSKKKNKKKLLACNCQLMAVMSCKFAGVSVYSHLFSFLFFFFLYDGWWQVEMSCPPPCWKVTAYFYCVASRGEAVQLLCGTVLMENLSITFVTVILQPSVTDTCIDTCIDTFLAKN